MIAAMPFSSRRAAAAATPDAPPRRHTRMLHRRDAASAPLRHFADIY